ncbi:MAG: ferritin family protein [Tumebacillaceae bacterium]
MYPYYWPVAMSRVIDPHATVAAGFTDYQRFLQMTLKAIFNERSAQRFYHELEIRAHTPFQKKMIQAALDDEIKHEKMLTGLYHRLTGHWPQVPQPSRPELADFQEGIKQAFTDEIEAAEMYRDMYLMTSLHWVRDLLFEIYTDESEHAQRFTYIRSEL